jgi:hypothetical protein
VLILKNRSQLDTTLMLALGRRAVLSVYLRGDATTKVTGIRAGAYRIWYTSGIDWDPHARAFTRNCGFVRLKRTFGFRSTATKVTEWTVHLYPASSVNTLMSNVDPTDFPVV